jgi:uncharacterized surface protein with fasciclin (FAS1) repeats
LPDLLLVRSYFTLVELINGAGLDDDLRGPGPLTIFAPSDAAFAALPQAQRDALLADPEGALKQLLLYHVVAGRVSYDMLKPGLSLTSLQGEPLSFTLDAQNRILVNGEAIVGMNAGVASNGLFHPIDKVLQP